MSSLICPLKLECPGQMILTLMKTSAYDSVKLGLETNE